VLEDLVSEHVAVLKLQLVDLELAEGVLGHALRLLEGVVEVGVAAAEEVVEEDAEGEDVAAVEVEVAAEGVKHK
jgi:hypothetical protein